MDELDKIRAEALALVGSAASLEALEAARVATLGKKGSVSALMASLGKMSPDER